LKAEQPVGDDMKNITAIAAASRKVYSSTLQIVANILFVHGGIGSIVTVVVSEGGHDDGKRIFTVDV
jgi:hypothetical protein